MCCGVVLCGVVRCGVVWCGAVCGRVRCGVVWCGAVWCGVVVVVCVCVCEICDENSSLDLSSRLPVPRVTNHDWWQLIVFIYQWFSARLQYLQCISNGDTVVLH